MIKRLPIKEMTLVAASTLASVASWEYFVGTAEPDPVGIPTYGFGSTKGVKVGDTIDPVRAVILLNQELEEHVRGFAACLGDVPITEYELSAYSSWVYNVGVNAACKSTLVKKLKAGDYAGACKELLRWRYADGKVLPGLVKRRLAEFETCIGGKQ